MILTFADDLTSTVQLDSQLISAPESGLYLNRGGHPLIDIDTILTFLPNKEMTFAAWNGGNEGTTYGKYDTTNLKTDIVMHDSKIYESILGSNLNQTPGIDTTYWLETNIESLRLKNLIKTSKENMINALSLHRKLIENQNIYNVGDEDVVLPNDYSGYVFEPKNSDYVKIRINQIALQANTTDPVNLYVINQGQVKQTIVLNPNNGIMEYEDVTCEIYGKGIFYLVFPSQSVKSKSPWNDALMYDGFVCYPVTGTGASPQAADYSEATEGNGLSFNVSTYLYSDDYITNNLIDFAKLWQLQFQFDVLNIMLYKTGKRISGDARMLTGDKELLSMQTMDTQNYTVVNKYKSELKKAISSINRTFDDFLTVDTGISGSKTT